MLHRHMKCLLVVEWCGSRIFILALVMCSNCLGSICGQKLPVGSPWAGTHSRHTWRAHSRRRAGGTWWCRPQAAGWGIARAAEDPCRSCWTSRLWIHAHGARCCSSPPSTGSTWRSAGAAHWCLPVLEHRRSPSWKAETTCLVGSTTEVVRGGE